jgi:hypothetical protein
MDVKEAIDCLKTKLRKLDRVIDAIEAGIEGSVAAKQERSAKKREKRTGKGNTGRLTLLK